VVYETNGVGARDVERPEHAEGRRIVVLGDSFLEGWGLPLEERLSNRLEAATGIPHLNFAMAHFSPYQASLAYRDLAAGYDHDAVVLGILPANDFLDSELALAEQVPGSYVYRPYLVGDAPRYSRQDHREPRLRFFLRQHSYLVNALLNAQAILASRRLAQHPVLEGPPGTTASWFYDYDEAQVQRLAASLRMLADEAGERPVVVLLIPVIFDIQRFEQSGPDPLAERLRTAMEGTNVRIVDLLPLLARSGNPPEQLYFPCDFHWSPLGSAVAAQVVRKALTGDIY
jgi:hypothetical protein